MFPRIVLWLSALWFVGLGLVLFVAPEIMQSMQLAVDDPIERIELRAVYGGMELGIGLFLLWAAMRSDRYRAGLILLCLVSGAVVAGRLLGIAIEGGATVMVWGTLALESMGFVLGVPALYLQGQQAEVP